MVVAERKPLKEILTMLEPYKKILVAGCKGCVTVCNAGGKKEVEVLAAEIRIARKKEGQEPDVQEITIERQCDPEYIELLEGPLKDRDAVISIACSVGPQYIAGRYSSQMVFPGLNTTFIGGSLEHGVFAEFCQACGACGIHNFGGPVPYRPLFEKSAQRALRRFGRRQVRDQQRRGLCLAVDPRPAERVGPVG